MLIYVAVVFQRVYHRTYTSKFILNILFWIIVWTLRYLSLHSKVCAPVCSVCQWLVVCSICLIFYTFPCIVFCSYLSLTHPVLSVNTCINLRPKSFGFVFLFSLILQIYSMFLFVNILL